ncbi:alpha/beta fold hydrolase [Paenibacillus sp. YYML68]|uniref:alpha/beta fold hydrolase n=1 Tax=Paenibacillus sp. YYML68 TaxID=2909250 RepID=UPI00248FA66C|nr:alpha/beta hydrolase [Paenibacillus sp. YYML68]
MRSPRRLLWIHGWGASPRDWERVTSLFAQEGAIELEADSVRWMHYYFTYDGCKSKPSFQQALHEQVTRVRPHAIVAWSMGGMLLLDWLIARCKTALDGEAVQEELNHKLNDEQNDEQQARASFPKIILVSSTLSFLSYDRALGWPRRIVERMKGKLEAETKTVLQQFRASMLTDVERRELSGQMEAWESSSSDFSLEGLRAGLDYLMELSLQEGWDVIVRAALAEEAIQLLWLHGENDSICPLQAMPEGTPGLQRYVLEGAGHAPFLTQPELFYKQLRGFIHDGNDTYS